MGSDGSKNYDDGHGVHPSCSRRCRQDVIECKPEHTAGRQRTRYSPDLEVIFVEVKSGSAHLNQNERSLKDAIINKRVRTPTDNEQAYILEVLERWLKLHAA